MSLRTFGEMLKETASGWLAVKAPQLGAALAYYTLFSLGPLLIIVIAVAGQLFGAQAAKGEIVAQIEGLVGAEGARAIEAMIAGAGKPAAGRLATIVGAVMLFIGASGVFGQLQDALNRIWGVTPKPGRGLIGVIRNRSLSFAMVLGIAFILLVSLVVTAALAALSRVTGDWTAGVVGQGLNFLISLAVITLLFAMIFKLLPDVKLAWRDVWLGAAITSVLFALGKLGIGLYLGHSSVASAYGAAGSLVVLLVWVYYSAQILLFGAEFTQVWASRFGSAIVPADHAMFIAEASRGELHTAVRQRRSGDSDGSAAISAPSKPGRAETSRQPTA